MIRKKLLMFALVGGVVLLSACTGSNTREDDGITVAEIRSSVEQAVDLSGLRQQNGDKLEKLYGIKSEDLEDFVLYTASSNVKADELLVIQVKQASETADVTERIEQRVQELTIKFKDYRPKEFNLVEKQVLKSKGRIVFFVVSEHVDRMEEAYDAVWK